MVGHETVGGQEEHESDYDFKESHFEEYANDDSLLEEYKDHNAKYARVKVDNVE